MDDTKPEREPPDDSPVVGLDMEDAFWRIVLLIREAARRAG
jgi:hypothetical protein